MGPVFHLNMFRKILSVAIAGAFLGSSLYLPQAQAGWMVVPMMPAPGARVHLSMPYTPSFLKGLVIHPDNALKFDFLVYKGDSGLNDDQKMQEYNKLIKYFLAALTVPDDHQWVNLSPYEKDRIVEGDFGLTAMGRDLLSQDYLLKQMTSSLMYPESDLGKVFWDKVYQCAHDEFGTTNIPVNTFNKVWIVPDEALIYESGNTAYVVKSHLKVMLEEDYLSLKKHAAIQHYDPKQTALHSVSSQIIKDVILPQLEQEVNEGKNFAALRQIFSGMVLATWYKKALRESLLGQVYADKAKVLGINQNPENNQLIYHEYVMAFKKGVYNYIKEDVDRYTNEVIPRKYFAGGFTRKKNDVKFAQVSPEKLKAVMAADAVQSNVDIAMVELDLAQISNKPAMGAVQQLSKQSTGGKDLAMAPAAETALRTQYINSINTYAERRMDKEGYAAFESFLPAQRHLFRQSNGTWWLHLHYNEGARMTMGLMFLVDLKGGKLQLSHPMAEFADHGKEFVAINNPAAAEWFINKGLEAIAPKKDDLLDFIHQKADKPVAKGNLIGLAISPQDVAGRMAVTSSALGSMPGVEYDLPPTPVRLTTSSIDHAMKQGLNLKAANPGGIDLNAANMNLMIKRDGKGVPLPVSQQDIAQLSRIRGFVPTILEIRPFSSLPMFSEK